MHTVRGTSSLYSQLTVSPDVNKLVDIHSTIVSFPWAIIPNDARGGAASACAYDSLSSVAGNSRDGGAELVRILPRRGGCFFRQRV